MMLSSIIKSFNYKAVFSIFSILILSTVSAQENININYVEYAAARKEAGKASWTTTSLTRLWFNDTIGYISTNIPTDSLVLAPNSIDTIMLKSIKENYKKNHYLALYPAFILKPLFTDSVLVMEYYDATYLRGSGINKDACFYYNYVTPGKIDILTLFPETKEILGINCQKAVTTQSLYNCKTGTTIWFAPSIPYNYGPTSKIRQLPGLIMQIENEDVNITLIKLQMPAILTPAFNWQINPNKIISAAEYQNFISNKYKK